MIKRWLGESDVSGQPDFNGRIQFGFDAIGDGRIGNDCYGHGTQVAGNDNSMRALAHQQLA